MALRHRGALLERNLDLVARNLDLLEQFFACHRAQFAWVRRANFPEALQLLEGTLGQPDA